MLKFFCIFIYSIGIATSSHKSITSTSFPKATPLITENVIIDENSSVPEAPSLVAEFTTTIPAAPTINEPDQSFITNIQEKDENEQRFRLLFLCLLLMVGYNNPKHVYLL